MWPIKHPKTSKNDLRVTKTPVKSLWSPWKTHQKVASIISIIQQPWKFPISSSQYAPRSASPKCVVWPSMVAARPSMPLRMASHVAKVSVQCGSPAEVARRPGRTNWSRGSRGSRGDLGETWGNPRYAEMVISGSEMVLNQPKYLETNWILEHSGISIYIYIYQMLTIANPPKPWFGCRSLDLSRSKTGVGENWVNMWRSLWMNLSIHIYICVYYNTYIYNYYYIWLYIYISRTNWCSSLVEHESWSW